MKRVLRQRISTAALGCEPGSKGKDYNNRTQIRGRQMKKIYERPAILHTEKLEARAVNCAKADDVCAQAGGPIQS